MEVINMVSNSGIMTYHALLADGKQVVRTADYIGSFLVSGKGHQDRAEVVRQKLEAAQAYTHSKPILLFISLNGIKVCREKSEHVYMAHALRRISYATCDPEKLQFAFLAREPKAQSNVQYCHAFVTANAAQAEEMNNIVGEAFRLAYAQKQQQPQSKADCSPGQLVVTTCDVTLTTAFGLPAQTPHPAPTQSAVILVPRSSASSSSHLLSPQSGRAPPEPQVIHKPLPPVPHSLSPEPGIEDLAGGGQPMGAEEAVRLSREFHSPSAPPSSPVVEVAADASLEHKLQKAHKHRHRSRLPGSPRQHDSHMVGLPTMLKASDEPSPESRVSEVDAPSTGNLLALQPPCLSGGPAAEIPVSPPRPPLRGLSQVCSPCGEGVLNLPVNGDDCSREMVLISSGMREKFRLAETDTALSRPLSDVFTKQAIQPSTHWYSPHFYDMAEHQSCQGPVAAALATPSETPVAAGGHQPRRLSQPPLMLVTSQATAGMTLTGATTSTNTTSSSVSFSDGSVGSLPAAAAVSPHLDLRREPTGTDDGLHLPALTPNLSSLALAREAEELANAVWYRPGLSRDTVVEMLLRLPSGSFVVRNSASHSNCYAISVRFGSRQASGSESQACRQRLPSAAVVGDSGGSGSGSGLSTPQHLLSTVNSVYPQVSGISHFLIERTARGGVRLKGLEKEWPSLPCLVLHLTVMPEMLPCPLRLPTTSSTPGAVNVDFGGEDQQSAGAGHFCPIEGGVDLVAAASGATRGHDLMEDYQCLSDFSSIMADLRPRKGRGQKRTPRCLPELIKVER